MTDPGAGGLTLSYPLAGMSPPYDPGYQAAVNTTGKYQHAVYLSIDGMHESDLSWYVNAFPESTLAALLQTAVRYTNARTTSPSDSAPGTMSPPTGASPRVHGFYYDDA